MKKLWLGIIGLAAASTAHAAIVTYTLSINESPTGTVVLNSFVVWASVSTGDNSGLATYGVDLNTGTGETGPAVTITQRSPGGSWDVNDQDPNFDPSAAYPQKTGGFTLVRQSNAQGVYSGSQDLLRTPDFDMHKVVGMGQTAGSMATIVPTPAQNADGTTVAYGPYHTLSGANTPYGTATNRSGVQVLAAGSIRLFSGTVTSGLANLQIQPTVDTSAAVWLDNTQSGPTAITVFNAQQVNLAFRDFQGTVAANDTVSLSAAPANANQAVGNAIAVTGSNNQYISEVDQLIDPSVNKGSAVISTIHGEAGTDYVMANLIGTAADRAAVLAGSSIAPFVVTSSDPQFAALHAIYDSQFGTGGFNALFKFANISGDLKAFNWDFSQNTAHGAVTVDQLAVVPEPASIGLLAFAGLGLLARRRRVHA